MKKLVRISEYSYGKVSKSLRRACDWINKNQLKIKRQLSNGFFAEFDYPDYFGLPKSIINRLYTDEVDFIQAQVGDFVYKNYKELPSPLSPVEFRTELNKIHKAHEENVKKLEKRLEAFQKLCEHENTHFESDPSGGSDSCYICVDCEKEL